MGEVRRGGRVGGCWGLPLLFAALLAAGGWRRWEQHQVQQHPERLLGAAADRLGSDDWDLQATLFGVRTCDANGRTFRTPLRLAWQAPNRCRLEYQAGTERRLLLCDGKSLWVDLGQERGRWRMPAPPDLRTLLSSPMLCQDLRRLGCLRVLEMLPGVSQTPWVTGWQSGIDTSSDQARRLQLSPPPRSRALTALLRQDLRLTCWAARGQLRRASLAVPPVTTEAIYGQLLGFPPLPPPPPSPGFPGQVLDRWGLLELTLDVNPGGLSKPTANTFASPDNGAESWQEAPSLQAWLASLDRSPWDCMWPDLDMQGRSMQPAADLLLASRQVATRPVVGRPTVLQMAEGWSARAAEAALRLQSIAPPWVAQGVRFVVVKQEPAMIWPAAYELRPHGPVELWRVHLSQRQRVDLMYRLRGIGTLRTLYIDRHGVVVHDSLGQQPREVMEDYLRDTLDAADQSAAASASGR